MLSPLRACRLGQALHDGQQPPIHDGLKQHLFFYITTCLMWEGRGLILLNLVPGKPGEWKFFLHM